MRHYCKIANSGEGMNQLMEHTLQRQLAEQRLASDAKVGALQLQVAELATLLKAQLSLAPALHGPPSSVAVTGQMNVGPVNNTTVPKG